jgi:hypothetical protein
MFAPAPTLEDAKRASASFAQLQAERINADLKHRYLLNFSGWETMVLAGKIPNTSPPKPPNAWIPVLQDDGFTYEAVGSQPVCAMPPIPADYSKTQAERAAEIGKNNIAIGQHLSGAYWAAGENDTCKSGFRTPPMPQGADYPAGSIFEKVGFFMGNGWWLKVA